MVGTQRRQERAVPPAGFGGWARLWGAETLAPASLHGGRLREDRWLGFSGADQWLQLKQNCWKERYSLFLSVYVTNWSHKNTGKD